MYLMLDKNNVETKPKIQKEKKYQIKKYFLFLKQQQA
jgi:hypothetical protein